MNAPVFSGLALDILEKRYLSSGETPEDMFGRVASWVAQAEGDERSRWEKEFFSLMRNLDFLPNSPCLMNAGTSRPQLAACFVFPVEDSMDSIFDTLKNAALTHKYGGGTGFSFSRLRPRGSGVGVTGGRTSGPVPFIEVYDKATEAIKQGGRRRGANMGVLRVDHPDIEEFIEAKLDEEKLNNFNISVAVTDEFMEAVKKGSDYTLSFPPGGKPYRKLPAREVLAKMARGAWKNGEPGIIFIDRVNRKHPLNPLGEIESTNPCGEQPLLPYEACILGSVNLENHTQDGEILWERLKNTVSTGVRFLDDALDMSEYPLKEIEDTVRRNRKIGLGVMGFASMLMRLNIPYASPEGIRTASRVMRFIRDEAHAASGELGEEKGEFPSFYRSRLKEKRRNAMVTTIAPTGTLALIAGTSSGIEPVYSLYTERVIGDSEVFSITDRNFINYLEINNIDPDKAMREVAEKGGVSRSDILPEEAKRVFLSATEINPRYHVAMQAAFQRFTDNAISKTVNLPEDFTVREVEDIIFRAFRLGCKGITVYRQFSRRQQVMNIACACEKCSEN